jgi:hypothetical protein
MLSVRLSTFVSPSCASYRILRLREAKRPARGIDVMGQLRLGDGQMVFSEWYGVFGGRVDPSKWGSIRPRVWEFQD